MKNIKETRIIVFFSFLIFRLISGAPPRTFSQTNIHQYSNTLRNQWSSGEWNILNGLVGF